LIDFDNEENLKIKMLMKMMMKWMKNYEKEHFICRDTRFILAVIYYKGETGVLNRKVKQLNTGF
jgi:hypothetical protein